MASQCLDVLAVFIFGDAALQELHGHINAVLLNFCGHLFAHALADVSRLGLHLFEHARASIAKPFQLAQACLCQLGDRRLCGLGHHCLVRGPLGVVHTRLFLGLVHGHHAVDGFRLFDLLFAGQHAVHDFTHLACEDWQVFAVFLAVDLIEFVADRFVNAAQPGAETLKHRLHLQAWSLAFKQVDLVVVGP